MGNIIPIGNKQKTALMLRVGGLGDLLILTPIGKALYNKGYKVDYFCGSPTGKVFELIEGLKYFNSVKELIRVNGIDCITDEDGHLVSVEILKQNYDEVFDFKFSVENNKSGLNKDEGWRQTINSNFQNWIDLSFSWANIDPTKVLSQDKLPEISVKDYQKYFDWFNEATPFKIKGDRDYRIIGVQLQASTLIRSWYKAQDLPELIHSKYPDDIVAIFANGKWYCLSKYGRQEINFPDGYNHLICSAVLIQQMNCFISADSGSSHLAEALEVPTIDVYTTVPAWTRIRDYKYAYPIEPNNVECHPCFTLDLFCPIERGKAIESLTEEERNVLKLVESGINPIEIARKLGTMVRGVQMQYEAIKKKVEALSANEPACVRSITPDKILLKVDDVLGVQPVVKHLILQDSLLLEDKVS